MSERLFFDPGLFQLRPPRSAEKSRNRAEDHAEGAADGLKILIATDAWTPQVNGVVRTLETLRRELTRLGHQVRFFTSETLATIPLPSYPDIRIAPFAGRAAARAITAFRPDAIHIATEGPIGWAMRKACRRRGLRFTTSFHTRFPDYVCARLPFIPERALYGLLRRFHAPAACTMVATSALRAELAGRGFARLGLWPRGVDAERFQPRQTVPGDLAALPRPLFLYVGRLAVEKNVGAFLALDLPGTKLVAGDGPERARLQMRFPQARFLGTRNGTDLAELYAAADAFVFPSRTDTFGLVMLEALASGVPVAAYPAQAPLEVLGHAPVASLDEDLQAAALKALALSRESCRAFAEARSWRAATEQFLVNLALVSHAAG